MTLEIQVLVWMAQKCGIVKPVNGIPLPLLYFTQTVV